MRSGLRRSPMRRGGAHDPLPASPLPQEGGSASRRFRQKCEPLLSMARLPDECAGPAGVMDLRSGTKKAGQDVEDPDRPGETAAASPVMFRRRTHRPQGVAAPAPYQSRPNMIVKLIFERGAWFRSGGVHRLLD